MIRTIYLLSLWLLLFTGCAEKRASERTEEKDKQKTTSVFNTSAIQKLKYTDYALSGEAEDAVAGWEKYKELAIQIEYLKDGDLSFFNGDKVLLTDFLKVFKEELPEVLTTRPILSRVTLVETMILKLNDDLTLTNIEADDKLNSVLEVLIAFSNLNLQIDKKLERDIYDQIEPPN